MQYLSPKEDKKINAALERYARENGLTLPSNITFEFIIDGLHILVGDAVVLRMGLHPASNYAIRETEHTNTYLKKIAKTA